MPDDKKLGSSVFSKRDEVTDANRAFLVARDAYRLLVSEDEHLEYTELLKIVKSLSVESNSGLSRWAQEGTLVSFSHNHIMVSVLDGSEGFSVGNFVLDRTTFDTLCVAVLNHPDTYFKDSYKLQGVIRKFTDKQIVFNTEVNRSVCKVEVRVDSDFLGFYFTSPKT